MSDVPFTLIDDGRPTAVQARVVDGAVWLDPDAVRAALGAEAAGTARADLVELAARLDRPLALDLAERAAFLGVPAHARAERLLSLAAPDFTLPDLEGRRHSLSAHRGKKVLLVAYASW